MVKFVLCAEACGAVVHMVHMPMMNQIRGGGAYTHSKYASDEFLNSMFLPLMKKAFINLFIIRYSAHPFGCYAPRAECFLRGKDNFFVLSVCSSAPDQKFSAHPKDGICLMKNPGNASGCVKVGIFSFESILMEFAKLKMSVLSL